MSPSLSALSRSWERGWFGLCSYSSAFLAFSRSGGLGSGSNHGGRRVSGTKNEIHSQGKLNCARCLCLCCKTSASVCCVCVLCNGEALPQCFHTQSPPNPPWDNRAITKQYAKNLSEVDSSQEALHVCAL